MSAQLTLGAAVVLMTVAALGYALATLGMKLAAGEISALALALVVAGLAGATLSEIALLRGSNLAVIYLGIIACESLLVLSLAVFMGDRLDGAQMVGGVLVLGGFALICAQE